MTEFVMYRLKIINVAQEDSNNRRGAFTAGYGCYPVKEIVNLIIARHDIDSVFSILIENGLMNRPGGGFLYSCPVQTGMPDTNIGSGQAEKYPQR